MTIPLRPVRETDDLYAELLDAHSGLTPEESACLNARLILIMMGRHIEAHAFRSALAAAKEDSPSLANRPSRG